MHLVRRSLLLLLALTVIGSGLMTSGATVRLAQASSVSDYCLGSVEQEFLGLINTYRSQKGLGSLSASATLGAAAQHHAVDMATTGTLAHTLSDGTTWLTNIVNHGYPYSGRGENIAWGYASAQAVFDAWKASPSHNENMLYSGFGAIGIYRVFDASAPARYYWVTTFGSRLDTSATICGTQTQPTATATPKPATSTPTTVSVLPTATATRVPLTSTATSVPPTATATSVPATATPVPPTATVALQVPVAPSNLTAATQAKFVQLTWVDNANNESGFRVLRSDNGGPWVTVGQGLQPGTTKYRENKSILQSGHTYTYVVEAYNASGSAKSNTVSLSGPAAGSDKGNGGKGKNK